MLLFLVVIFMLFRNDIKIYQFNVGHPQCDDFFLHLLQVVALLQSPSLTFNTKNDTKEKININNRNCISVMFFFDINII